MWAEERLVKESHHLSSLDHSPKDQMGWNGRVVVDETESILEMFILRVASRLVTLSCSY